MGNISKLSNGEVISKSFYIEPSTTRRNELVMGDENEQRLHTAASPYK